MEEKKKNKSKNIATKILVVLIIIAVLLVGWNKFQEWMFFHPWNDHVSYTKLKDISEFQEVKIKNDKVNLSGWFWNIQNKDVAPLVIFFTGNAQNSSNTLFNFYQDGTIKEYFGDYNLMIVDYPGYGISKGKPSDDSMFEASDYIYEYAKSMKEVDSNNIAIMGYSIGTGVASYCASKHDANSLILVAPYDRALSLYNDFIDSFHGPIESLARYSFDSATYAESITESTFIITSKDDEVIRSNHSLELSKHFSNLDDILIVSQIDHNSYFASLEVLSHIKEFLNKSIK
jgi:pimeloyl-ACP methyl ester carboxylesterase